MSTEINDAEWDLIQSRIVRFFGICGCQRKIKTIVDNLLSIKKKCIDATELGTPRDFTGAEWLVLAMMENMSFAITHGINCEYPIINEDHEFWIWLEEIKNNPNLKDN